MFEIWLSSEDTGAYGIDLHHSVADLLHAAMDVFASPSVGAPHFCHPQPTMLRLGMTNPPYILHHLPAIVEFLRHPNVFAFIHIPVQSGSDRVLGLMQRAYTAQEFCRVCDYLLKHCPGVTIATDIIVGFAGETEEDHQATMRLLQRYEVPTFIFVNKMEVLPAPGDARRLHATAVDSGGEAAVVRAVGLVQGAHAVRAVRGACDASVDGVGDGGRVAGGSHEGVH